MKKVLALILIVVMLFVLSGCGEREITATPQSWAVKYAVEHFDETYDEEVLVNVSLFDYAWVDDELTVNGWNAENGYLGQAFKVDIYRLNSEIEIITMYVFLIWEIDYSALDYVSEVDGKTKPIKESQIVDIDIEVVLYD